MDRTFSRDDTKLMKGAAIVLMLMHHLWGFPGRIAGGELWHVLSICGESSLTYFGSFGKICVSFFFFLGGYGVYLSTHSKRYDLIAKLKGLYLSYWKVFVIFIPLAFFFCAHQPTYCDEAEICTRYAEFSRQECFNNFIGFSTSYNSEWWFLNSYICALILYPVIDRIVRRHSTLFNIWTVIIGTILITNVFPAIGELEVLGTLNDNYLYHAFFLLSAPYTACFWMGAVFAKGNLLIQLQDALRRNNLLHPVLDVFFIGVIIQLRSRLTEQTPDMIYVPFLILFFLDLLRYMRPLRWLLLRIGKESTSMWLIHPFFCYYFYPVVKIVVAPRWGILCLLVLLALSYIAARLVRLFWQGIGSMMQRIQKIFLKLS